MQVIQEISKGQVATMMAVVTVAASVVEGLIKRGVLSVADGQAILGSMAEEIRRDGDEDDGKTSQPSYGIAASIEARAFAMSRGQ